MRILFSMPSAFSARSLAAAFAASNNRRPSPTGQQQRIAAVGLGRETSPSCSHRRGSRTGTALASWRITLRLGALEQEGLLDCCICAAWTGTLCHLKNVLATR